MYSILNNDININDSNFNKKTEKKTAKGIKQNKKYAIKQKISHADFKNCLFSDDVLTQRQNIKMNMIRSVGQTVKTITVDKVGLCAYDDKSYYIDSLTSLRYGHYKISEL